MRSVPQSLAAAIQTVDRITSCPPEGSSFKAA